MYSGGAREDRNPTAATCSRLLDLGSQIIAHVAHVGDLVLSDQGHVRGHAQRHSRGERRCLGEQVKITQGKGEGDRLLDLNNRCIILLR
jgi:hypothetical protein